MSGNPGTQATSFELLRATALHETRLNLLVVTLGHCRGLTASIADLAVLKSFAELRRAQRLAPRPAGAHRALLGGLLPGPSADPAPPDAWLPAELVRLGYQTAGVGWDACFSSAELVRGFERFERLELEAREQLAAAMEGIDLERPFFAFANLMDTRHRPTRDLSLFDQVAAAERVDAALGALISTLPERTLIVACSDFGLCFGEGNCWGRYVEHPVSRDVFVARFRLDGEPLP
jgi:hypothetical protein